MGTISPKIELHGDDDGVGDHHGDHHRDIVGDPTAECALQRVGERGGGEGADPDRGHGDADLDGGDVLVDALQLAEGERGAAHTLLAHHLQARAARAHEGVLGDHEERVDGDQKGRED